MKIRKKSYAFLLVLEKSVCPQAPLALGNGPGIGWSTVTSSRTIYMAMSTIAELTLPV